MYSDSQTHLPMLHLLHTEAQTHRYTHSDSQTHLPMLHLLHIETQIMKARDRRHHLPWCSLHFGLMFLRIFVTARKRSLRQGNVLTPVCHSVHRGALPPRRGLPGGLHPGEGLHPEGVCIQGGLHPGGCWADSPPHRILRDMVTVRSVRILLKCILV